MPLVADIATDKTASTFANFGAGLEMPLVADIATDMAASTSSNIGSGMEMPPVAPLQRPPAIANVPTPCKQKQTRFGTGRKTPPMNTSCGKPAAAVRSNTPSKSEIYDQFEGCCSVSAAVAHAKTILWTKFDDKGNAKHVTFDGRCFETHTKTQHV